MIKSIFCNLEINRFLTRCSFILVLATSAGQIDAQIEKGMTLLSVNGHWDVGNGWGSADLQVLRAVSNRWMIGGQFRAGSSYYQISPSARYYFSNSKWAPFASVINQLTVVGRGWDQKSILDLELQPGVGLTRFLGANVALEAQLSASIIRFGRNQYFEREVNLDVGLKLFLGNPFAIALDSLPGHIYRKGVFTTTSFAHYNRSLGDRNQRLFSISPNVSYFVSDRLSLSAGFGFLHLKASELSYQTVDFSIGATRYFELSDQFYFNIGIQGGYAKRDNSFSQSVRSQQVSASLDGQLSYFAGAKRIFLGYRCSYFDYVGRGASFPHRYNQAIYTGLDYYVSRNLFFKAFFNVNLSKNNEQFIGVGATGVLSLGMGYNLSR